MLLQFTSQGWNTATPCILHENQLSYISNFKAYAQKCQCVTCERHFKHYSNMKIHQKTCKGRNQFKFPGGFYGPQKLYSTNWKNKESKQKTYFFLGTWSTILNPSSIPYTNKLANKLEWTHQYIPIYVSIWWIHWTVLYCGGRHKWFGETNDWLHVQSSR